MVAPDLAVRNSPAPASCRQRSFVSLDKIRAGSGERREFFDADYADFTVFGLIYYANLTPNSRNITNVST